MALWLSERTSMSRVLEAVVMAVVMACGSSDVGSCAYFHVRFGGAVALNVDDCYGVFACVGIEAGVCVYSRS